MREMPRCFPAIAQQGGGLAGLGSKAQGGGLAGLGWKADPFYLFDIRSFPNIRVFAIAHWGAATQGKESLLDFFLVFWPQQGVGIVLSPQLDDVSNNIHAPCARVLLFLTS